MDWLVAHAPVTTGTGWQAQDGPFRGMADENFWHAIGALLTLIVADNWRPLRDLLNRRTPQFLGRISFPLYLVHVPILLSLGLGTFLALLRVGLAPAPAWVVGGRRNRVCGLPAGMGGDAADRGSGGPLVGSGGPLGGPRSEPAMGETRSPRASPDHPKILV